MKKISFLGIAIALFYVMFFANAVQTFSVSPTTFTQNVNVSTSGSGSFVITNTGDENINLTITKVNLANGSNNINLNVNTTTIVDLVNGSSNTIGFSYVSGTAVGNYVGSITVTNTNNGSITTSIPVNVAVTSTAPVGSNLNLVDISSTIVMSADIDERETKTVRLENDGTVAFTNVRFSITDLEGQDSNDQIDASDVDFDPDGFNLAAGSARNIEIEVDMPRNIEVDTYEGTLTIMTNEGYTKSYSFEVVAGGEDVDVIVEDNSADVRSALLTMIGEEGDTLRNYEFSVSNEGDIDVNGLRFELDGALKEEFSSNTIPTSAVTFFPSSIDLDSSDEDVVEVRIAIPEGQVSGNYFANIRVESSSGELYDDLRLKVKVIGDVYIKAITFDEKIDQGDDLDVNVVVKNQGSQLYRNVKISATLFDADTGNTDIHESSSTFLLDVGQEKNESLRFQLPEDASDGSHTLEIRVDFGDEQIVEVEDVIISRPLHNIIVDSFAINPGSAKCSDDVYTYIKVKNLGKYDEDIKVTSQIEGTNQIKTTSSFELGVDEVTQKNLVLNVEGLAPGEYKVVQRVTYSSNLFIKKESTLRVNPCDEVPGVIVKPINDSMTNQTDSNSDNADDGVVKLFGKEIEKTTAYLGAGVGIVFILIIFALFLL